MQVIHIVLLYLDSGCSKHMTRDRSRLMNFVKKFIGTVRFWNDHFGAIMGYGDYVIGDSVISRVYYMEGLGHNLFFVKQFCDFDLEVAFRKHSCYVRDTDGVKLIKGSRGSNLYTISVEDMINQATVQDDKVVVQNVQGRQNKGQGNNARGAGAAGYEGAQNRVENANLGQVRQIKCYNCNGGQDNVVDEDVDEQPVQDVALNVDNVFQADNCDAFNSNVDEAPTAQTMFMDAVCEHHEVHEMHDDVQPNYVVDSHADYTSDSNRILYDQYVKDNTVPVVQSNVSSVLNDAYMMILNDMHEQPAQHVFVTTQNNVVDKSLTAELATYKEQVALYERRAKFELTEREQKINEQLRKVITDCNIKEENLKKELHSVKMQLTSTINHNKSMVEEVTSLKRDFKQKGNKYLEEFLDMKA
nr:integrase, catalytic region, zinc finger, CCHC-type, peptidase aspartic, catalytic [Tanacetum cinerariifolium]